jgi:hypothetical protein
MSPSIPSCRVHLSGFRGRVEVIQCASMKTEGVIGFSLFAGIPGGLPGLGRIEPIQSSK